MICLLKKFKECVISSERNSGGTVEMEGAEVILAAPWWRMELRLSQDEQLHTGLIACCLWGAVQ